MWRRRRRLFNENWVIVPGLRDVCLLLRSHRAVLRARRGSRLMRGVGQLTALVIAVAWGAAYAQPTAASGETLVMPFDNPQADPKLYWLGEGSALLLAEFLERYGGATVPRDVRVTAFERLQLPPAAALSHATVIKIGQVVGAADVVIGSYELAGAEVIVHARAIRLEAGRLTPEIVERGLLTDLFAIYERTARRLRDASSPAPSPLPGTLLTSLQAYELYVKGLVADAPTTERTYLEQALKAAPADDRIRLALWQVHTDAGDHFKALEAVTAVPSTSLSARTARYLAALAQVDLKRYDEAFATLRRLQSDAPSAEVLNALGIVQLRRGGTVQTGRATYYFSQATQTDPGDADYFFNLGYAYWIDKDPPAAVYWLREAVRLDPTDGDAHQVLGAALQQTGAMAEATRENELARRLSSSDGPVAREGGGDAVPRGLERLKPHLERPSARVNAIITSAGQRDQDELATFHLETGRRAFAREADREAEQELRRALYLSPYRAEAHLLLGRVHLRSGRVTEAIQAFKIALWSEDSAAAHIALAEAFIQAQQLPAAKEEIDRALALNPSSPEAARLGERLRTLKPPQ